MQKHSSLFQPNSIFTCGEVIYSSSSILWLKGIFEIKRKVGMATIQQQSKLNGFDLVSDSCDFVAFCRQKKWQLVNGAPASNDTMHRTACNTSVMFNSVNSQAACDSVHSVKGVQECKYCSSGCQMWLAMWGQWMRPVDAAAAVGKKQSQTHCCLVKCCLVNSCAPSSLVSITMKCLCL